MPEVIPGLMGSKTQTEPGRKKKTKGKKGMGDEDLLAVSGNKKTADDSSFRKAFTGTINVGNLQDVSDDL